MSARRNSSVTSKYLSVCAERKRPWPEIPESRKLPNISDFTVSKVDEDATISVSEFRGGSWRKSGHGLPIQFGYRLWPLQWRNKREIRYCGKHITLSPSECLDKPLHVFASILHLQRILLMLFLSTTKIIMLILWGNCRLWTGIDSSPLWDRCLICYASEIVRNFMTAWPTFRYWAQKESMRTTTISFGYTVISKCWRYRCQSWQSTVQCHLHEPEPCA